MNIEFEEEGCKSSGHGIAASKSKENVSLLVDEVEKNLGSECWAETCSE